MLLRHRSIVRLGVLISLVIGPCGPSGLAEAQTAGQNTLRDSNRQSNSIPPMIERAGVAVIEVAPELTEASREQLRQALAAHGLILAAKRPDGFPLAGKEQELLQNVWALEYDTIRAYADVRAHVIEWCRTSGDAEIEAAVLGILPGFENESDRAPIFFRPGHVVVMLTPMMPLDRVVDSLAGRGWLSMTPDSLVQPAFVKYLWRRVTLRVDPAVGVFAALDSLRELPWIRAASPVLPDWGHLLPVFPRVSLMRELVVGTLRKLGPLELVVIAHACRVDGPEAGVEVARNSPRGADSLGRIRVKIETSSSYERFEPELRAWKAEIVSHEEREDHVVVAALLPVKWIAVCTASRSVIRIYPYDDPGEGR